MANWPDSLQLRTVHHIKIKILSPFASMVGMEKTACQPLMVCFLSGRWRWREPGRSRPGQQTSEAELLQRLPTKVQTKVCMSASLMQGCNNRRVKHGVVWLLTVQSPPLWKSIQINEWCQFGPEKLSFYCSLTSKLQLCILKKWL